MEAMTTTTTATESMSERASRIYLMALNAQKNAEKMVEQAKDELQRAFATEGVTNAVVDGQKVSAIEAIRRNFHPDILQTLVEDDIFRNVTKIAVEPKAFDNAIKNGTITTEIEEKVVTPTPYTRIVVTENKVAEDMEVAK
jgi:hypothetical protein